jgi:hypothetical protein
VLDAVLEVFEDYADQRPLPLRQVFYVLVGRAVMAKDETAYAQLQRMLDRARRARVVPFGWLRDDGVSRATRSSSPGPATLWRGCATRPAAAPATDRRASARVELWSEAAGLVPQIARIAEPCSIPVVSSGGADSLTNRHELVERIAAIGCPGVVLHVGDVDVDGEDVFRALSEDVAASLPKTRPSCRCASCASPSPKRKSSATTCRPRNPSRAGRRAVARVSTAGEGDDLPSRSPTTGRPDGRGPGRH